jgi:hypothetical protein
MPRCRGVRRDFTEGAGPSKGVLEVSDEQRAEEHCSNSEQPCQRPEREKLCVFREGKCPLQLKP